MPVCSACGVDHPKEQYSKAQLGKKGARRCKLCIPAAEAGAPAAGPAAGKKKKQKSYSGGDGGGDDDLALLAAAMAENAAAKQDMELRAIQMPTKKHSKKKSGSRKEHCNDGYSDLPRSQQKGGQAHCQKCSVCGTMPSAGSAVTKCFSCDGCQGVWYCSSKCQNLDWKHGHKRECSQIREERAKAPTTAVDFYHQGLDLAERDESAGAIIEAYEKALALNPDLETRLLAHNNAAVQLRSLGRNAEALERHLNPAVAIIEKCGPTHPDVGLDLAGMIYTNCGNSLKTADNFALAKTRYETAIAFLPDKHPRTDRALTGLAMTLSMLGEADRCESVRRGQVNRQPKSWFAHYNLSVTLSGKARTLEELDEAIAHASKADGLMRSSKEPNDADVPTNLGALLIKKRDILNQGLVVQGCTDVDAQKLIVQLHSDGCMALQAALKIDPHHPAAAHLLATVQTGKATAAVAMQPRVTKGAGRVGTTVRLDGLKTACFNNRIGTIERGLFDERVVVALRQTESESACTIKVKPVNLVPVCSNCSSVDEGLSRCNGCKTAQYCGVKCQKAHWKAGHCTECAGLRQSNPSDSADDKKCVDHASWKQLDPLQRQMLRDKHAQYGCSVPWPIAGETPAMLQASSFLSAHPEMVFHVTAVQSSSYLRATDVTASHRGPAAPNALFILREDPGVDYGSTDGKLNAAGERYHARIPPHLPCPMKFCVVGEVTWTAKSKFIMDGYYHPDGRNKSAFCRWPGGNVVAVCPGTGKIVQPSTKERHLLVAQRLQGMTMGNGDGSRMNLVDRIMPRILTMRGYDEIMDKNPSSRVVETMKTVGHGQPVQSRLEFYPYIVRTLSDNVRSMAMRDGDVQATMAAEIDARLPIPAHIAWEVWTGSGQFAAFDRYLNDGLAH